MTKWDEEWLTAVLKALREVEELQRKIDIDHAEYTNLWAENQRLKQERPKGRWIYEEYLFNGVRVSRYRCSNCHKTKSCKSDFCPNCGADMRNNEEKDV